MWYNKTPLLKIGGHHYQKRSIHGSGTDGDFAICHLLHLLVNSIAMLGLLQAK
jgi:hypothetical protein